MIRRTHSCAALLLAATCLAQPRVVTFHSDIDDSVQPYALYVPGDLDPAQKYPLVLSLHMEETDHILNLRQLIPPRTNPEFIVAAPRSRGGMGFRGLAEKDVYDVLADVKRRFPIDDDRVYLTGISMGGGGALWFGLTRPDLWAAIAPLCPDAPEGTEELAGNALNVPIRLFHGENDPIVPVASSRRWQKRFLQLGVRAEYLEYPGLRHNAWDRAYRNGGVLEWFARFKRDRYPERVRFTSSAYKYASAYWVHLDRLTPGSPAGIDTRFTAPNRVLVSTSGLDGFTLRLDGHPQFHPAAPLEIQIDGVRLRPKGHSSVSFIRAAKGWIMGSAPAAAGDKRPGLEGPLGESVAARHIYVYGTADTPGEEEIDHRRRIAQTASRWSMPGARVEVSFAVKPDRAVTAEDMAAANLILFGNKETNSLVAHFAGQFPIELNAGAADYGLVFVLPIGRHYVVVNSGRPWWTGADQARRSAPQTAAAPWRVLQTFGDYILFKGTLERVVAEGRFDRNWKLPPAAAEQMLKTGAVVIPSCCRTSFADTATR